MSEVKAKAGRQLRWTDFEKFKADLELLLTVFTAQTLANWMGKDKGNFSKRINGQESITPRFLVDFYGKLEPVIIRLRQGAAAHQVEKEMNADVQVESQHYIHVWIEIGRIKSILQAHEEALRGLQTAHYGPEGPQDVGMS